MKAIAFFCVGCLFFCAACEFDETRLPGSSTERVRLSLPAYPDDRPTMTHWLMVREKDGRAVSSLLSSESASVDLILDKNLPAPVLFFPLVASTDGTALVRFFKPAGCVYPSSKSPSWPGGFAAQLCLDILTHPGEGSDAQTMRALCNGFNWQRLQGEIATLLAADDAYNPWEMDITQIAGTIAAGKFTKTALKVSVKEVNVAEGFAPGPFYQSYLPAQIIVPEERGTPEFTFPYCQGNGLIFDGTSVFLVQQGKQDYRLALMPIKGYTWEP
jgi:hypothetical protein